MQNQTKRESIRRRVKERRSGFKSVASDDSARNTINPPLRDGGKNYRVVSVSLYSDQAQFVDQTVDGLLTAGFLKANRSLVIQTAVQGLQQQLEGKNVAQLIAHFLEHQGRRPLAPARKRSGAPLRRTGS